MRKWTYIASILIVSYTLQACCLPSKFRPSQSHQQARENMLAAPYVAIQAKINYKADNKSYKGQLKIHIHRGHRIWVSITHSWGGELWRCNITPGGVEVINRIDRSYQFYNYAQLQADWQIPCSYDLIQAMLLAELPPVAVLSEVLAGNNKIIKQAHAGYVYTGTVDTDAQRLIELRVDDPMRVESAYQLQDHWQVFYKYRKDCRQDLLFSEAAAFCRHFNFTLQYQKVSFSAQPLSFAFNRPLSKPTHHSKANPSI